MVGAGGGASDGVLLDLGFIVLIAEDNQNKRTGRNEQNSSFREEFQNKRVWENIKGTEKRGRTAETRGSQFGEGAG